MVVVRLFFIVTLIFVASCAKKPVESITIGINPWPGYEPLYLAEQKGLFKQANLDIRLVQMSSLADTQRAYLSGRIDGMASTMIEVVQATQLGDKPLQMVLVPDYSNGGDVLITRADIGSVNELKGKTIGCEVSSLGIFMLYRALAKSGLGLNDVKIVNTEQLMGEKAMLEGTIDAFVSYPPVSVDILKHEQFHTIFTSADIPKEVIDSVAVSTKVMNKDKRFVPKLHNAWQMALDYMKAHPEEAYAIMAEREGISVAEFSDVLSDLVLINQVGQASLFSEPDKLQNSAIAICEALVHVNSLTKDCDTMPNIIYRGAL